MKSNQSVCFSKPSALFFIILLLSFFLYHCHPDELQETTIQKSSPGLPVHAGLVGPGQGGPGSTGHPPLKSESWHKLKGDVMALEEVWGTRIAAQSFFQVPGGIGMLYNSKPPDASEARAQGIAANQTGSLAFTRNLIDWVDYPGNPVLYEVQDWQGSARVMVSSLVYDEENEIWVTYYGDAHGDYPGIRACGVAYSTDLLNWTYEQEPVLTIMDYAAAVPDRIQATEEELLTEGRIYCSGIILHEGTYYMRVSGSNITGENREYGIIMLTSQHPAGPFEYLEVDTDATFSSPPVYWNGTWYSVFPGTWDGEPGFGLSYSSNLLGPYEENPHNPIFTVETTQRSGPLLIRFNGSWAVIYTHQHDTDTMPMRIAVANMYPDLIPNW